MNKIEIDKDKCIKCGLCIKDCLTDCIDFTKEGYPELIAPERCLACRHCLSVCPNAALSFNGKNPENSEATNYTDILSLIKSRRSVRKYKQEEIPEEKLKKLKDMLHYTPTGCNSHALHFSIVEKKEVMDELRTMVNKKILKALNSKILSPLAKKFEYYKSSFEKGDDIIFRNAPHLIVASSPITAPCAQQDPIIALSYLELYAQSLGIGTCWCGYAALCIKLSPELCDILDIPAGYEPIYAMLLGIPDIKYHRTTQPDEYKISVINEIKKNNNCVFCKIKRFITNFIR